MRNIELTIDDIRNIKRISFVAEPAVKVDFRYFSEEMILQFSKADVEKRLVTGLAMRPNIKIPRVNKLTGEKYTVSFTSETVRLASELYLKQDHQRDSNIEHQYDIDGVCLVESYIINDDAINNAVALGFEDVMKDDWWITFKVDNDELWNEMIKTGLVKGFSVEGLFIENFCSQKEYEKFESEKNCCNNHDEVYDFIKNNLSEENFDSIKNKIQEYEFDLRPPLHENCTCYIFRGRWILGDSESGPCKRCIRLSKSYNTRRQTAKNK